MAYLFTSCGYQREGVYEDVSTISVPYIVGDVDGQFTAILIEKLSQLSGYQYVTTGGYYTLKVEIISTENENIGFRYDRHKNGRLRDEIIPVETRLEMTMDVTLFSSFDGKAVLGPSRIRTTYDFDHDWYSVRNGVNVFSLGQLTDVDSAEDAALKPLQERASEKIVDFLLLSTD